ncbi:unnamed protein product [Acanthoscelides obtectus]|uniref:DDE-1 domain-containing protein n=1 Tax=Acanthoscelides obtectus TaxID=200917 RepID=A0A9P0KYU7_ACAOB|nr:unnamed protein product [Acanthoscelides obtectus]CAK1656128.1 hypothetical protein AOBTE_LOCUS19582 [Acanthoscelides obtectus]
MNMQLMKGAPPGSIGVAHPSGWVQCHIFTQWFRHFIQYVKPTKENPILLILDGHYSHTRNIEIIDLARENFVTILRLPPHSTHKLQPLDKSLMGPLKVYYSEEIRIWIRQNQRALSPFDIMELFDRAYEKVQTYSVAENGFRVTGICPFNRNVFTNADYIAAEQEAAKRGITVGIENLKTIASVDVNKPSCSKDWVAPIDIDQPSRSKTSCEDNVPIRTQTIDQEKEQSSDSKADDTITKEFVSPFDISPVPNTIRKKTNRGRKVMGSAVITSSPYKDELNESINKKTEKEAKVCGIKRNLSSGKSLKPKRNPKKPKPKIVKPKIQTTLKRPKNEVSSDETESSEVVTLDDSDSDLESMRGHTKPKTQ